MAPSKQATSARRNIYSWTGTKWIAPIHPAAMLPRVKPALSQSSLGSQKSQMWQVGHNPLRQRSRDWLVQKAPSECGDRRQTRENSATDFIKVLKTWAKKLQRRGANGLLFTAAYKWFSWGRLQERISLYYSRPRICFCIAKYVSVNNLCCYYEGRHDRKSKIIRQDSEVAVDIIHKGVIASAWFAQ